MNSNLRIVCVYTEQYPESVKVSERCVQTGISNGYVVELYQSVYWKDLDRIHSKLGLRKKYTPVTGTRRTTPNSCPASRMANGTTHYMLYQWCVENNEPICIVEHDAMFVGQIPEPIDNGVIQISSHCDMQADKERWYGCGRAAKMRKYEPEREFVWDDDSDDEVRVHPLSGMNGTSGYIISPGAARKMVEYIQDDGIAYGDRVRTEHIGEGNLYLQVPQSVICDHQVKTAEIT